MWLGESDARQGVMPPAACARVRWEQGNLFASGVNTGRLLNILLAVRDLRDADTRAAVEAAAHRANTTMMARRPGGAWVPCADAPAPYMSKCMRVLP